MGKPPRDVFLIQLNKARAEWRRRNPRDAEADDPHDVAG